MFSSNFSLHGCLPFSSLEYDVRSKSGFPLMEKESLRVVSSLLADDTNLRTHATGNGNVYVGLEKVFKRSQSS